MKIKELLEAASSGSTSAGGIASIATPMGFQRRQELPDYESFRKRDQNKTGGMAVAPDPLYLNADEKKKRKKNKKKAK